MAPPRATLESVALLGGSELHRDAFASRRERVATTRVRVVGFAAGAICALLAVAALAAGHGEFHGAVSRGALAALGRGSRNTQASKARGEDGDWPWGGGPRRPPWQIEKGAEILRRPQASSRLCTTPRAPSPVW